MTTTALSPPVRTGLAALIGGTPMMAIEVARGIAVYAKMEMFNPLSSIKDRVALYMIEGAERRGDLAPGGRIIEATSGNTGIALAALAALGGYDCTVVMPDSATPERIQVLTAFGASVELTPADEGYQAAIDRAAVIQRETPNSWFACQHENEDNVAAHYLTTGPEMLAQLDGRIDFLVCGVGTGGTITGIARHLKERLQAVTVVAVEPNGSPVLSQGWGGRHQIPGLNGGFVASTTDVSLIDRVQSVSDDDALVGMRRLMRRHGVFAGVSAGAAFHVASAIAVSEPGAKVATVLPDGGDRYLSILATTTT